MKRFSNQNTEKKMKVCIIGHFGGKELLVDGQTVKTKTLYNELSKRTNWTIKKVDTYYKKRNPLLLAIQTIIGLLFYKKIIVLLSGNGMKIYFPILYIFIKARGTEVYHDVIGGNLDKYVEKKPKYKKILAAFRYNFVETELLKNKLERHGVNNCLTIPNFKDLNIATNSKKVTLNKPIRFCTFSRVTEEKGITDAIETIRKTNKKEEGIGTLDIYGPVEKKYAKKMNSLLASNSKDIKYCGVVQYDRSVDVLSKYDILLFPTHWEGEGFPGTIVDAFAAGVPVIATNWRSNSEIIHNYKTGITYPNEHEKTLEDAIKRIVNDKHLYEKMRYNCLKEATKYVPEKHMKRIIKLISQG